MNKSRYPDEQVTFTPGKVKKETPISEVILNKVILEQTTYSWGRAFMEGKEAFDFKITDNL